MLDQNNDYSAAGPGFKRRRQRERLAQLETPRDQKRRPTLRPSKSAKEHDGKRNVTPRELKDRVRRLVLIDSHLSAIDVRDILHSDDWPGSVVLVGSIRQDMRDVMRLLEENGLLDRRALEDFRREHQDEARIRRRS